MDQKRVNRNEKFCTSVRKKDVSCVLSSQDGIQCECAHIVPLNGEFGQSNFKNPEILNDNANGMLLSKELHYLYDQFIWCINPEDYEVIEGIPEKHKYNIEIVESYKDKKISICNYKVITLRSECHEFVKIAFEIFKHNWNPQNKKKLEIHTNCKFNISPSRKEHTTIQKLKVTLKEELEEELVAIIQSGKNLTKRKKEEISMKYNIHPESIQPHFSNLKKNIKKRPV